MKANILCSSYYIYYVLVGSQFPREILLPYMVEN